MGWDRTRKAWNSKKCYCDGKMYESLFQLAVDYELSYSSLFQKIKRHNGNPVRYSGHTIVLESYLAGHPEYDIEKDRKEKKK